MNFFFKQTTKNLLHKAELNLSASFLQTLTPPYLPQKKIKNLILQEQLNLTETDLQTANQLHKRESGFFSASYSGDWLLLGMSKEKIGVDLECIKPRNKSFLKSYKNELKTHFGRANRNTFYLLRTAKEAVLKASDSNNLDHIAEIKLFSIEKKTQIVGNLTFNWELICGFQKKEWEVWSFEDGEKAYSITFLAKDAPKYWLSKLFFIMSGICFFTPFFFYWLLHTDYNRYLGIIKQDFPFSNFGSGPFQFWLLGVLPLFAGCIFIIIAFVLRKHYSKSG